MHFTFDAFRFRVTAPAVATNVGDILIEYAVNVSEQQGSHGLVGLAVETGSCEFYKSIGFTPQYGVWPAAGWITATLTPTGPKWSKLDNTWNLSDVWEIRAARYRS